MSQSEAIHTDSADSQKSQELEKKAKSRRPANTAFRQQRLKAWQPILTPKTVLPLFFAVGIIFAPIGGLLLWASAQVQEIVIDYSDCIGLANPDRFVTIPGNRAKSYFKSAATNPPTWKKSTAEESYYGPSPVSVDVCSLQFQIPDDMGPPVLFYYRLTNFYQNHRRYVKSLDTDQLKGKAVPVDTIRGGSCDPLRLDPSGKPYYPCGLIANSLFNDTFSSPVWLDVSNSSETNRTYNMLDKGIAWDSDRTLYGRTEYSPDEIAVPPNWQLRYNGSSYTAENIPKLEEDEAFQVWMRTAGLPAFSKLARRNDNQPMQRGRYQVDILSNFPVTNYGGTKSIVISTRTVMGGKNPFLGIAYIVVGGICILLGAVFTVAHLIKPRKLGDHTYLTWNNDQPSTATATGISRPGNDAA